MIKMSRDDKDMMITRYQMFCDSHIRLTPGDSEWLRSDVCKDDKRVII